MQRERESTRERASERASERERDQASCTEIADTIIRQV